MSEKNLYLPDLRKTMRILLLSDIHSRFGNLRKIITKESFDLVFIAGDITNFRAEDIFSADEILSDIECYAVHGNCDPEIILNFNLKNITFIHGKSVECEDFTIHGLGGSLPTGFETPSEYPEEYYTSLISKFEFSDFNILLSHCPANGILDKAVNGLNLGSVEIAKNLNKFKIAVTGHVHECAGILKGKTLSINPGPVSRLRYAVLDPQKLEAELKSI